MIKGRTMAAMDEIDQIRTKGDLRRLVSNSLLALARKEISATDVEALAKGLDSISNSLNTEIKLAKLQDDIRRSGGAVTQPAEIGRLLVG